MFFILILVAGKGEEIEKTGKAQFGPEATPSLFTWASEAIFYLADTFPPFLKSSSPCLPLHKGQKSGLGRAGNSPRDGNEEVVPDLHAVSSPCTLLL